ncbi:MAG: cyclase family protein [Clostridia bacterium]|nr:cyclase family protein [Clostridia bacterium]
MKTDVTLRLSPAVVKDVQGREKIALSGHIGTHFDVIDKEFPLDYTELKAIVFDVSGVKDRDIEISDIDTDKIRDNMFVAFYSGFMESAGYGTQMYFKEHPQLSHELIEKLLQKNVSVIGVDFAGIRRGSEHTPADQYCADRNVFVIENLCNLNLLTDTQDIIMHTYPMNFTGLTGLPCRVIAEI